MLLSRLQRDSIAALGALYPAPEARSLVLMLCEEVLGTTGYTSIVDPSYEVADTSRFDALLGRLLTGEPIQYVLGFTEWCGRRFKVSPSVLIPRPETEILCREAVATASRLQRMRAAYGKGAAPVRVLDLCTGSGCIAWTLAQSVPGVEAVAVDISPEALEVAASQPFKGPRPTFVQADILSDIPSSVTGPFDLILSNPPYIRESEKASMRPNVLDFEPELALFVPDDDPLLFYRAVARWSSALLAPEGFGAVEINESLPAETAAVFSEAGFRTEIRRDLAEKPRFVIARKHT